ncbi:GNAT family N-acetyltransferase [Sphingomonas lycopersici]|uniref:GNAT family N-acetyltransferase n=1 Tax=Sphingomonas lycopersici TaxID=2951807 RepID=A0AA42CV22_9SPHN|nr:GNAT family N-acetyltransferase [Sphingomonas lycopersici]MCW6536046.1 GNAT family N-acetyltransferase [Sphingomonas lycopersici]
MYHPITEPLDVARHDRSTFESGVSEVDKFFRHTANKLTRAANLRTFVLDGGQGTVLGFYAQNAAAIDYRDLPARYARTRPGHGEIPAVFISMIGIDQRVQGKGLGRDLLVDCLWRITEAERSVGIALALLDILDCGDPVQVDRRKDFYLRHGFAPLPGHSLRMFMPIATLRELVGQ